MYLNYQLKSVLISSGIIAAAWTTNAAINKKIFGSGFTTQHVLKKIIN